ncbi:TIGR03032 family protein [Planktothrix paucivesiculata]|uniref:protein O-GlcNAc transferase n=1 Tax=Planktothrix paucivesiculata PCC 9631 TaxID=671071 RepID=A0A7Z9BXZ0_9CYAN|nr:TIGR03032 family protein [Planktothrix paucivesiculata]VXD23638.1 conserved hypothetical protein [Planktothrix paucivesiculata PCC 9631]
MTDTKTKTLTLPYSRHFVEWLQQHQVSLALTTYQTNRLCLIGVQPNGEICTPVWELERPMGLYTTAERFYLATRYQIWRFENVLENGELLQEKYDRLYVPRVAHTTGDLDIHDLVADDLGNLVFVNTEYSCLATLHPQHSFAPIWKPPFISKLAPEDRCHLNGLAAVNGVPRYVTAISRSDVASGWRHQRTQGGVVIDIQTDEIIASGLSMPHSPRWYRGKLWILNSGTGDFGYIQKGEFVPLTFCPGYARGLGFVGDFAVVGLSQPRDYHFSGLLIAERLKQKHAQARCGILIINLNTGDIIEWLDMDNEATELYDVAILPQVRCPISLGFKTGNIAQYVTIGGWEKLPNTYINYPIQITDKIRYDLPLFFKLFRSVNWREDGKLSEAIAWIYIQCNKPIELKQNELNFSHQNPPHKNQATAYFNQGQEHKKQGEIEQAIAYFQKALAADPKYIPAHNNLGTLLQQQNQLEAAITCYQKVLNINPNLPQTLTNLASIYLIKGELKQAETGLVRALELQPQFVPALYNLGLLYKQQAKLDEAVQLFKTVAKHQPDYGDAYFQLGRIWEFQEQFNLAQLAYERVQKINPKSEYVDFHIGLIKLNLCDWENYDDFVNKLINFTAKSILKDNQSFTLAPFQLNALPIPPELSLAVAQKHADGIKKSIIPKKSQFVYPEKTDKLRVGYVSCDFREHAVGRLISQVFKNHNREQFEIFGYHLLNIEDEVTKTIKKGCDKFRDISQLSAMNAAGQINADGIDILIDLAGYTSYSKPEIFAYQPAPIQASFLGYPQTMGANFIPYLLTDEWLVPPELAPYYSEKIIYLPHQFICSPMEISEQQFTRTQVGLPENSFVFACFNRSYKITLDLFAVWMAILRQVQDSVLWLSLALEDTMQNLRRRAGEMGVAAERLIFAPKIPHPEYLARLQLADLALDTWIYNGVSTTIAALWAGLPVLTKVGLTHASRMGASICASAGMTEMICNSVEEYEQKAIDSASHPQELQRLRQRLNPRCVPLFDGSGFVGHLETAFRQMANP